MRESRPGLMRTAMRVGLFRLLLYFFVLVIGYAGVQLALAEIAKHTAKPQANMVASIAAAALCLLLCGLYALLVHWTERRWPRELSPFLGLPLASCGVLFGALLFCAVYAILWLIGVAQWRGVVGFAALTPAVIVALVSAVAEELAVRGGVYRILEDSFGTAVALILSAALFGMLHACNSGATPVSTAAIALEAGVLLGAAYAATRNLWFPIGLHFGWNFTEGGVFGAVVSGSGTGGGILSMPLKGPEFLTGGAFGPEASIVAVAVCLAAAVPLLMLASRTRRWVRLSFNLMLD